MQLLTDKSRLELFTFMHKLPFPVLHNDCPCFAILHLQNQLHAGPHFFSANLAHSFRPRWNLRLSISVFFQSFFAVFVAAPISTVYNKNIQVSLQTLFVLKLLIVAELRNSLRDIFKLVYNKTSFWGEQATRYAVLPLRQHSPIWIVLHSFVPKFSIFNLSNYMNLLTSFQANNSTRPQYPHSSHATLLSPPLLWTPSPPAARPWPGPRRISTCRASCAPAQRGSTQCSSACPCA